MATIENNSSPKHGNRAAQKKLSTHIDMTPMVDLGFLLITFFMLTTTMIQPQTMELILPTKNDGDNPVMVKAITIVLGENNKVYWFEGTRDKQTGMDPKVSQTNLSNNGIRQVLLQKNTPVIQKLKLLEKEKKSLNNLTAQQELEFRNRRKQILESKGTPMVIIKAMDKSNYANLVDILDEMHICSIGRYAVVELDEYDRFLVEK